MARSWASYTANAVAAACCALGVSGAALDTREADASSCMQTEVVILGAGLTGITAGQALTNNSINDFLIVEYNNVVGGRVAHTDFGTDQNGDPYVVELGANWVQGIQSPGGPANPIWTLAKKYHIANTYSNYTNITTYDHTGPVDYVDLINNAYEDAYSIVEQEAGDILTEGLLDRSARAGFNMAGWTPRNNAHMQAVDWWEWDWEYAFSPEETSQEFGIVNYNTTFYQYSEANNYVYDQRGFSQFIKNLSYTYLQPNDPRLLLNTVVTNITYSPNASSNVTVHTANGTCINAKHAIMTFSVGVLQAALAVPKAVDLTFHPSLPGWKFNAIQNFDMGIYTKIFLQFDKIFWPEDTQFFLYASPTTRGYYPVWQSLSAPGFLKGSGIIFVTVVNDQSRTVEAQSDDDTKEQVLAVLRQMYGANNVPEPKAFFYPRWGRTPWAMGSYSNWPTGVSLQSHQNLRANVGNLWFAGEATSAEYFGFLQAAHFEGQYVANNIANCLKGNKTACQGETNYKTLLGTANQTDYTIQNGWEVTSFQTVGDV